jgi:hypothetical protein
MVRQRVPLVPLTRFGKPWDRHGPRKRDLSPLLIRKFMKWWMRSRLSAVWSLLTLFNLIRKTETCILEQDEIIWDSECGPYRIVPP